MAGYGSKTFYERKRIEFSEVATADFQPAEYLVLDWRLMRPVEAGLWKLHETFDGTYTADDMFDINELLDVQAENKARATAATKEK